MNNPKDYQSIMEVLAGHALTRPASTAYIFLEDGEKEERRVTWLQLWNAVEKLAGSLAAKDLQGKSALLIYRDVYPFIISFLACQYLGIVAVPLNYMKGKKHFERWYAAMEDAQAAAVLCCSSSLEVVQSGLRAAGGSGKLAVIPTDHPEDSALLPPLQQGIPGHNAFIQYTSGSTGKPKGVVITGGNLWNNQQQLQYTFGCDSSSIIFSWLPFHHDMGLIGSLLNTVYTGCTCIWMSPVHFMEKPGRWLQGISRYRVTHSGGPDFAFNLCAERIPQHELTDLDLSCWKVAYNGSEPVRHSTIRRFDNHFKQAGFSMEAFYPCYGLAEATLIVSGCRKNNPPLILKEPGNRQNVLVSSGAVVPGATVKIIGEDLQECVEMQAGEICVAGGSITAGYWNRTDQELFYVIDGKQFLRTGDRGFLYQGELFVHGRIKEMLIVRGENYYPADIEQLVADHHPAIETGGVAVFTTQEEEHTVVVAEVRRNYLQHIAVADMINSIDRLLTGELGIIAFDIVLTTPLGIPRTTSGKLQRLQCRALYATNGFTIVESLRQLPVAAKGGMQNKELQAAVLKDACNENIKKYLLSLITYRYGSLPGINLPDAVLLTELGVDSLRAMELINIINGDLDISVDASRIFYKNTLAGLIRDIEEQLWLKTTPMSGNEIVI